MNCSIKKQIIKNIEAMSSHTTPMSYNEIELLIADIPILSDDEFNKKMPIIIDYILKKEKLHPLISILIYSLEKDSICKTKNIKKIDKRVVKLIYLFLQCLKEYIKNNSNDDIYAQIVVEDDYKELENALKFWKSINKGFNDV